MPLHKDKTRQTAVALRYRSQEGAAPKVVASGHSKVAEKILKLAKQYDIPIYQEPILVEALARLEVGTEIPSEFYQVIAEILAFVYSIDEKWEKRG